MKINKNREKTQQKYHIVVTKTDGHGHSWLGPRCGQDGREYSPDEVLEVNGTRVKHLLEDGNVCLQCARYMGLLDE